MDEERLARALFDMDDESPAPDGQGPKILKESKPPHASSYITQRGMSMFKKGYFQFINATNVIFLRSLVHLMLPIGKRTCQNEKCWI